MSCPTDYCSAASGCTRHASLALEGASTADVTAAIARLDALAAELTGLRASSARTELRSCGALLARRFAVDLSDDPDALRVDAVLVRGAGAPLALGAIAVTAAREAGIALGLLAGPRGSYAVAHATLTQPVVLDLSAGFARRNIAGEESLYRWLCAHDTAARLASASPLDAVLVGVS